MPWGGGIQKLNPVLTDRFAGSGVARGDYFHQDLLIARRVFDNKPRRHIDIGSRIDGFVAHVASFRQIDVIDIRPQESKIKNINFIQMDFMSPVKDESRESCDSLSCLHAIEHFGLGRYGDSINAKGHLLGMENLYAILKKGGKLYFSTPIGPQRVEFNAHRVFSVHYLLEQFQGRYTIDGFSYVDDNGDLHENIPFTETDINRNFGCQYGCGIFEMTKI
jgi:SAM-dependent methyltransferase